jgi:hypothetical protein
MSGPHHELRMIDEYEISEWLDEWLSTAIRHASGLVEFIQGSYIL